MWCYTWGVFAWTEILLRNLPLHPCWTSYIQPLKLRHNIHSRKQFILLLHSAIWRMVLPHKLSVRVDFFNRCLLFGSLTDRFHFLLPCCLHFLPVGWFAPSVLVLSWLFCLVAEVDVVNDSEGVECWFVCFFDYLWRVRMRDIKITFFISSHPIIL